MSSEQMRLGDVEDLEAKRDSHTHKSDPYKNSENKHRDKGWLEKHYVKEEKSMYEISKEFDKGINTIRRWLDRFDIPRRAHPNKKYESKKYRDRDWLKEEHIENNRTMTDIASECGVSYHTISNWLDRFGIEKQDNQNTNVCCSFHFGSFSNLEGYPVWGATGATADSNRLAVHRLVAIADGADPHDVFSNDKHQVHHRNGFKCDNRPSNLELVDRKTHGRHHTPDAVKWTDDDIEYVVRCMMNPAEYADPD